MEAAIIDINGKFERIRALLEQSIGQSIPQQPAPAVLLKKVQAIPTTTPAAAVMPDQIAARGSSDLVPYQGDLTITKTIEFIEGPNASASSLRLELLKKAANQATAPGSQTRARALLGLIYIRGEGSIRRDFSTALAYLIPVAEQNRNVDLQARAQAYIGQIYLHGDSTIQCDFLKALRI